MMTWTDPTAEPFLTGDVLNLDGTAYRAGTPDPKPQWHLRVSKRPVPVPGNAGWWHVSGWELNDDDEPVQFRAVCVRADNPRRPRPSEQPARRTIRDRLRVGSHWHTLDDLRGTATGLPWNAPGRYLPKWGRS